MPMCFKLGKEQEQSTVSSEPELVRQSTERYFTTETTVQETTLHQGGQITFHQTLSRSAPSQEHPKGYFWKWVYKY